MRFFASWWELRSKSMHFHVSHSVPAALLFLGAFGVSGHISGFIDRIVGPVGMLWG